MTQPESLKPPLITLTLGVIIGVLLDHWTKTWALQTLYLKATTGAPLIAPPNPAELYSKHITVTSWFNYHLVGNKGAAWGIFRDLPETYRVPFFTILATLALIGMGTYYIKSHRQWLLRSALILIIAGAIGNLLDRLRIGYVIDFIDWHYAGKHWPTFNIADVWISVGVGLMIIDMIRQTLAERHAAHAAQTDTDTHTDADA